MKVFKFILKLILGIVFTISLLGVVLISEVQNTVLDKEYILKKMENDNYYNNLYSNIINDMKGYIGPSGFDESIFNDILTPEKVKEDTIKVVENIYNGNKDDKVNIETDSIKQKLSENIDSYLESENLIPENKESLDEYEDKIVYEYEKSITYSDYYKYVKNVTSDKVIKTIKTVKTVLIILMISTVLGIVFINFRNFRKIISEVMTFIFASGIIINIIKGYITKRIIINNITLLNTSFSIVLRDVLNDFINGVSRFGVLLVIFGIIVIILGNLIFETEDEDDM